MCSTNSPFWWSANRFLLTLTLILPSIVCAQVNAPRRLMTDLLEHTDCVFKEGVLSTISLDMAFQDTRLKVAEIHTPLSLIHI